MCSGPLLSRIIIFALPLMLSGILQLLFNAADIIVVGRFTSSDALAAVGSTTSLNNLIINLFLGLSIGSSVVVARYYGAQDWKKVGESVHTSILISALAGVALIFLGIALARPLLEAMGTPENVLDQAVLYMRIIFVGMPAMMVYNFGAAILRAVGDTRRPLIFLLISGIINVCLNLFFVIVFEMGVAGVSLATVISQFISAALVVICLVRSGSHYRLTLTGLRISKKVLLEILRVGLPAGIQSTVFNISNVLIQSSINSFGSTVMAGSAAANNIENFVYQAMNAFYQTNLTFTGQNYGAGDCKRVDKSLFYCQGFVILTGLILGNLAYFFGHPLVSIYNSDEAVIQQGIIRLGYIARTYALCGIMDTMVGSLRGLGYSIVPMVVSLIGACGLRIVWIFTIFQMDRTPENLYISYPISWIVTGAVHILYFLYVRRKAFALIKTDSHVAAEGRHPAAKV